MNMAGNDTSVLSGADDHSPDQWRRATALFGGRVGHRHAGLGHGRYTPKKTPAQSAAVGDGAPSQPAETSTRGSAPTGLTQSGQFLSRGWAGPRIGGKMMSLTATSSNPVMLGAHIVG
jgi:hypothetical protein